MSIKQTYANVIGSAQADLDRARIEGSIIANEAIQQADLHNSHLKNKIEELEEEVDEYRKLLCKPMLEIANQNRNFKATYEAQMQLMADWMVSQKAFKELAIQFGFEKKLSKDDVVQMAKDKKIDVLDNKHDPKHNTNASDDDFIVKRVPALKEKIKNNS